MKPKKTFKSLDELSVDSIGALDADPQKVKPPESNSPDEVKPKTMEKQSFPEFADARGFHRWGINE
jgi:hypothetical protein